MFKTRPFTYQKIGKNIPDSGSRYKYAALQRQKALSAHTAFWFCTGVLSLQRSTILSVSKYSHEAVPIAINEN